jgi:adenylate cyclase
LRPNVDISFFQVFPPQVNAAFVRRSASIRLGEEHYVVSMFVDMRHSTGLAEKRLPFDTMFIINRFLGAVSSAIEEAGGQPNQYLGDGVLALFGLATTPAVACGQAIDAIGKIAGSVEQLNRDLAGDILEPIQFGIGVNGGRVILADIGYRDRVVFTALGDAVNVAARLQDMTKDLGCEVLIAEEVCVTARIATDMFAARELAIRGRRGLIAVRVVARANLLSPLSTSR